MKRITTNGDIQFPIESVRKLKGIEEYTIKFFTTSKTVNVRKTNNDVIDGIIPLEWPELSTLGTGVLNYLVEIPNPDPNYSDDTYNSSFTGTTIYYIISNIIIPDEDEVQDLMQLVSEIRTDLNAEITRSTGEDQEHDTKLADVYTKEEIKERLNGKADKNGSINESFNVLGLNLRREGANTTLYNYNVDNNEFVSFYDRTGGSLTYKFTPNQGDNIATERQLAEKANTSDVYTKGQVDSLVGGMEYGLEEPSGKLPKFSGNTIRILGIGNSYMTEGTRELEGFLTNSGLTENNLDLEIAYYPSRNLSTWYNCIKDGGGYEQLVQFKYNSSENYWYRTAQHNVEDIRETISEKTWDVIILQEFPSFSNSENASEYFSYEIYLKNVITLIKDLCPNPNLCFGWHMIWSNNQNLSNNGMVWEKICDAVKHTIKHSDISFIIPSGTALQNAYNTTPFRGYEHHFLLMDEIGHPASGAARYITAATFYEALISPIFGKSLLENQYLPIFTSEPNTTFSDSEVPITASNILPAKYSAISACKNRYFVDYNIESFIAQNYTKNEVNALLAEKADKNGNGDIPFNAYTLNLHREGANTALFNYKVGDYSTISFYDDSLGGIHYTFTPNQEDIIATERQLALKANTSDVYSKTDVNSLLGGKANSTDVYSKTDVNSLLAGKANKNGSTSEAFTTKTLNLQREGGSSSLYNYSVNDEDYISIYDRTGGSLTYKFTANQGDNIATERQLAEKANSTDVYSKNDVDTKLNGKAGYKSYNTLQEMEADTTQPNGTIGFDSNAENFYIFDSANAEWKPIDQTGGGGGGPQVQSNWTETDTTSAAYIQNKPTIPTKTSDLTNDSNFVDATNDLNVINATTVKFYDGISDYVAITGDTDANFDCNTLRFSDLYSGNEVLFSMAPGGYRLNLGDWRHSIGTLPAAVDGVSTVELQPGYTIFTSRWRANAVDISLTLNTPTYSNIVTNEYYVYIPGTTATIRCTGITFDFETEGINSVLWKDGVAPNIVSEMQASSVALTYLLKFTNTGSLLLAEYSVFKAAT